VKTRLSVGLLLVLTACGRTERSEPAVPAATGQPAAVGPWAWHPLGGLAVVEGEVTESTELVLEGPSIRERRFAEAGPVRWEFFRPPAGESAVLRTAEGRELARFVFSLAPPRSRVDPTAPRLARRAEPPTPPEPVPPTPKVRTEARLGALSIAPIPGRKTVALPSVSEAPADLPRRPPSLGSLHLLPVPPSPQPPAASTGPSPAWPGMGEAVNLTRGPGGQKRLLLSFDGGSSSEVATEVLDLLKARGIHTTLFLTGAFIQRYPALVKRMAADGHELGNHTMNHPHFAPGMKRDPRWTRERVQRELLEADAALVRLLGRPMDPYWRAPYGEHTAEIRRWAEELGYRHVGWSEGADTLDWATPKERHLYRSGEAIVQRLHQRLGRDGDGLIVLMHLGSARALGDRPTDGLGAFMDRARKEGWTFVSAGTFMKDLGKPTWDPHQRLALLNRPQAPGR
jgi:peptidoglycan/xylan/chitin deacetylase (PgdA/CDA1 family)